MQEINDLILKLEALYTIDEPLDDDAFLALVSIYSKAAVLKMWDLKDKEDLPISVYVQMVKDFSQENYKLIRLFAGINVQDNN